MIRKEINFCCSHLTKKPMNWFSISCANLPKICKFSLPHFLDGIERAVNSHAGGTTTYKSIRI